MNKLILACLLLVAFSAKAQQNSLAPQYAKFIMQEDLKENLSIIASDALEGRYTGERGQRMAASFINSYFEKLGLDAPVNGSHYMPFDLTSIKPGKYT